MPTMKNANKSRTFPAAFCTLTIAVWLLAGTLMLAAAEPAAPLVDGVWNWAFTMPDGAVVKPQVTLKLEGHTLTGKCSFRAGTETEISAGKIEGDQISFQVERERDGRKIITRYRGKMADGRIRGKIESNWDGNFQTYDWEAIHQNKNIEGKWVWGNRAVELQLEGGQLKGKLIMEDKKEYPLRHGSFKDGQVSFETERERDGKPYTNIFRAKFQDNLLKGKLERFFDGQSNTNDWEAKKGN
jgi:hypothetical protein